MTRLPGVYPQIGNGGLGIVTASGEGVRALIGVSSLGDELTLLSLSDVAEVRPLLGYGPLADAAAEHLAYGGGTVYAVRVPATVAGNVTPDAANPSANAVSLDGTADRTLDVMVVIVKGGSVGEAEFSFSLDGGDTTVGPVLTAASVPLTGTAHSVLFPAGTYAVGETYRFDVTAPTASIGDIQAGIRAAFDTTALFEYVQVVQPLDNSGWAALDALMQEAANEFRYVYAIAEAPPPLSGESADDWVARLEAMKASFSSDHVLIVADSAEVLDVLNGQQPTRSLAARFGARISASPVQENPGWVQRGPISGALTLAPFRVGTFGKQPLKNNAHALRLETAGYTTAYTLAGKQGYFWTDGRMAAAATSDYVTLPNRRVMNKAVTLARTALLDFIQQGVDPRELDASLASLKARAAAPLRQMQARGEISGHRIVIPPNQNLLSSRTLVVEVRIIPLGYLREIALNIAFRNPYLEAV